VQTPADGVRLFELPESAVWEVPLTHPELPWFAELGLRWHAVPAISNMRLSIGGVNYPFAPFNGWYLGTEIGARNFADTNRYNLLPTVARWMGLDTSSDRTLWRDRALVELNRAVLWSFDRAGARISDHHTESRHFLRHLAREERAGRPVPADWTWIVPPMSGAATPVFHRYYDELELRPNFYLDAEARDLGRTGRLPAPPPPPPVRPAVRPVVNGAAAHPTAGPAATAHAAAAIVRPNGHLRTSQPSPDTRRIPFIRADQVVTGSQRCITGVSPCPASDSPYARPAHRPNGLERSDDGPANNSSRSINLAVPDAPSRQYSVR
jgi:nitric-oxide synthase